MIYNIYVESIIFIRRNIYILLPYIFYEILNLSLEIWLPGNSFLERSIRLDIPMLIVCFLEMIIIVIVYRKEAVIVSEESIWQSFFRFSGSTLLLTVYSGFVVVVCMFVLALISLNVPIIGNWVAILVVGIIVVAYPLSLRHLIYYNNIMVMDSIKAGLKELYINFFFYLFVALLGMGILVFPSLVFPSSWLIFPFLPVTEFKSVGFGNEINWIRLLLNPILSTLTSVALTYAFIFKNKKNKHVS